jgi:precorrin-2 dehydrogenase / sirohydrochlorin ferrochelatase
MSTPSLFVALTLTDRPCLIVGSGLEAERRTLRLLERGARVTLVTESLTPSLEECRARGRIAVHTGPFDDQLLDGQWLALLTDRDSALAERMARAAGERRVFFCAVDQPEFSSFAHLAEARSADLTIAISTSGRIPALAGHLRKELQRLLEEANFSEFFERLSELRSATPPKNRHSLLSRVLRGLRFSGKLELPDLSRPGREPPD